MSRVFDSPVWHALTGPQAHLANGHGRTWHFPRDMALLSTIESSEPVSCVDLSTGLTGCGHERNAAVSVVLLGRTGMSPRRGIS
jgi:hypothetical protein